MREIERLYGELAPRLYRYLRRLTGSNGLAEDILQETFLRGIEHLLVSGRTLEPAWFFKVARHYYIDLLRREGRIESGGPAKVEHVAGTDTPDTLWEAKERRQAVQEVLNELPESYRTVLILREFEELSYRDISEVTGMTMEQVKVTLYRARRRFRQLFNRREGNEL